MINRELEPNILAALGQFPCVALLGARQVGKTTLARRIAAAKPGAVFHMSAATISKRRV